MVSEPSCCSMPMSSASHCRFGLQASLEPQGGRSRLRGTRGAQCTAVECLCPRLARREAADAAPAQTGWGSHCERCSSRDPQAVPCSPITSCPHTPTHPPRTPFPGMSQFSQRGLDFLESTKNNAFLPGLMCARAEVGLLRAGNAWAPGTVDSGRPYMCGSWPPSFCILFPVSLCPALTFFLCVGYFTVTAAGVADFSGSQGLFLDLLNSWGIKFPVCTRVWRVFLRRSSAPSSLAHSPAHPCKRFVNDRERLGVCVCVRVCTRA